MEQLDTVLVHASESINVYDLWRRWHSSSVTVAIAVLDGVGLNRENMIEARWVATQKYGSPIHPAASYRIRAVHGIAYLIRHTAIESSGNACFEIILV